MVHHGPTPIGIWVLMVVCTPISGDCRLVNISKDLETPEQTFKLSRQSNNPRTLSSKRNLFNRVANNTYSLDSSSDSDDDLLNHDDDEYDEYGTTERNQERFISFTFSGSRRGWDQFSVLVQSESGLIYRLCPVVPEGWYVPRLTHTHTHTHTHTLLSLCLSLALCL
jgi:hypothetical protein